MPRTDRRRCRRCAGPRRVAAALARARPERRRCGCSSPSTIPPARSHCSGWSKVGAAGASTCSWSRSSRAASRATRRSRPSAPMRWSTRAASRRATGWSSCATSRSTPADTAFLAAWAAALARRRSARRSARGRCAALVRVRRPGRPGRLRSRSGTRTGSEPPTPRRRPARRARHAPAAPLRHAGRRASRASGSSPTSASPQIEHALDELGWTAARMTAQLDFFFSFRSPYSYLAGPRAFALADRYDVEVVFRGVIPMAMRGQSVPMAKRLHTLRDVKRESDAPRHAVRPDPRPDRRRRDALPAGRPSTPRTPAACGSSCSRPAAASGRRRSTSPRDERSARRLRARRPRLGDLPQRRSRIRRSAQRVDANTARARRARPLGRARVRPRRRAVLGPGPDRGRRARTDSLAQPAAPQLQPGARPFFEALRSSRCLVRRPYTARPVMSRTAASVGTGIE